MRYLCAGKRGTPEPALLPVHLGTAEWIPSRLGGIVVTSDLQGIVPEEFTGEMRQMGIALVDHLSELSADGAVPPLASMCALLAGDFYSIPAGNKRGGYGPVAEVWQCFADEFARVIGVAGNHDDVRGIRQRPHVQLLDRETAELEGLRIGGVGLITGSPEKPGRRETQEHLSAIELIAQADVDILLLHQGPRGDSSQRGESGISDILDEYPVPLTICGHVHWENSVAHTSHGCVLNTDGRVIILSAP